MRTDRLADGREAAADFRRCGRIALTRMSAFHPLRTLGLSPIPRCMKPLALPDDERAAKAKDGRLVVDSDGHEVLVGLTREESEWYIRDQETWFEQRQANKRSPADKRRSRELRERHEKARFEAMALMNAKPQGNA